MSAISAASSQFTYPPYHIMVSVATYSAIGYLSPLGLEWGVLNGAMSSISRIAVEKCVSLACKNIKMKTEEKIRITALVLHIIISLGSLYASLAYFDMSITAWKIGQMAFLIDLPLVLPFVERHALAMPLAGTNEYLMRLKSENSLS